MSGSIEVSMFSITSFLPVTPWQFETIIESSLGFLGGGLRAELLELLVVSLTLDMLCRPTKTSCEGGEVGAVGVDVADGWGCAEGRGDEWDWPMAEFDGCRNKEELMFQNCGIPQPFSHVHDRDGCSSCSL